MNDRLTAPEATYRWAELTGIGWGGKTPLAVEYACSQRANYDQVSWVRGERPTCLPPGQLHRRGRPVAACRRPEAEQRSAASVFGVLGDKLHRSLRGDSFLSRCNARRPQEPLPSIPSQLRTSHRTVYTSPAAGTLYMAAADKYIHLAYNESTRSFCRTWVDAWCPQHIYEVSRPETTSCREERREILFAYLGGRSGIDNSSLVSWAPYSCTRRRPTRHVA